MSDLIFDKFAIELIVRQNIYITLYIWISWKFIKFSTYTISKRKALKPPYKAVEHIFPWRL